MADATPEREDTDQPDRPPTMRVRCNPAHAKDHKGEEQAAVPFEGDRGTIMRWVGATPDHERSKKLGRHVFKFDRDQDVVVPVTAYYVRKLEHRELLPSPTCETAKKFAPPAETKSAISRR